MAIPKPKSFTSEQKILLFEAWDYCDEKKKSTEFMLQYMADTSGCDYDEVVEWMTTPACDRDRASYLAKKNKEVMEAVKTGNTPVSKKLNFVCDICGEDKHGRYYPVYDENYNLQSGLRQCSKCSVKE